MPHRDPNRDLAADTAPPPRPARFRLWTAGPAPPRRPAAGTRLRPGRHAPSDGHAPGRADTPPDAPRPGHAPGPADTPPRTGTPLLPPLRPLARVSLRTLLYRPRSRPGPALGGVPGVLGPFLAELKLLGPRGAGPPPGHCAQRRWQVPQRRLPGPRRGRRRRERPRPARTASRSWRAAVPAGLPALPSTGPSGRQPGPSVPTPAPAHCTPLCSAHTVPPARTLPGARAEGLGVTAEAAPSPSEGHRDTRTEKQTCGSKGMSLGLRTGGVGGVAGADPQSRG